MIKIEVLATDGTWQSRLVTPPVSIGRNKAATVFFGQWRVAKRHADLLLRQGTVWIVDHGSWSGTCVNGKRILAETPLNKTDEITIGCNRLRAQVCDAPPTQDQTLRGTVSQALGSQNEVIQPHSPAATDRPVDDYPGVDESSVINRQSTSGRSLSRAHVSIKHEAPTRSANESIPLSALRTPLAIESIDASRWPADSASESINASEWPATSASESEAVSTVRTPSCPGSNPVSDTSTPFEMESKSALTMLVSAGAASGSAPDAPIPSAIQLKLHSMLLDALDLRREDVAAMSDEHLRARSYSLLIDMLESEPRLCPAALKESVIRSVLDEALGLGPLEPLLDDDGITEIMVNRYDEIYVERAGRLHRHPATFTSQASVLAVIDRIVAPIGRRIDESSPMVDARLPDGSRVNAVVAPVALKGATLTIRKFGRRRLSLDELVGLGALSEHMAAFLSLCVMHKKNIVVSGGTGSGKTTLLNILSGLIGTHERVITIEDAAELQLPHEHVVSLEARPANMEGRGRIDIRDLVRNALRMRPDRIVVGECRGVEAFDMLAAMNTGHEGSLTTLHANTPRDALARIETMILMAGMDLPLTAVREHIASGIDLIVQQARLGDGRRVVTDIAEVCGIDSGGIQLQPLLVRNRVDGRFSGIGVLPGFIDAWRDQGVAIQAQWFDSGLERP